MRRDKLSVGFACPLPTPSKVSVEICRCLFRAMSIFHGEAVFAAQHFQSPNKSARSFRPFPDPVIPLRQPAERNLAGSEANETLARNLPHPAHVYPPTL